MHFQSWKTFHAACHQVLNKLQTSGYKMEALKKVLLGVQCKGTFHRLVDF